MNDQAIGAFTVTSFAVSRGRLESLVGKIFVAGELCVYFAGILSLFAFILLTQKIMIMLVRGTLGIVLTARFIFLSSKNTKNEENWLKKLECVQL